MKKKHRDITVDGVKYGWIGGCGWLTIYKDKKPIWSNIKMFAESRITPSFVRGIIEKEIEQ